MKPPTWPKFGRLLVLVLIMLDTLRRIFADTRPIDTAMLIIELLVLALIAYEVADKLAHRWKLQRRKKMLLGLLTEARELQRTAYTLREERDSSSAVAWWKQVQLWEATTNGRLSGYSQQAATYFMQPDLTP